MSEEQEFSQDIYNILTGSKPKKTQYETLIGKKCLSCGRIYWGTEAPQFCSCTTGLQKYDVVGPFKLLEPKGSRSWEVECILCGDIRIIDVSNLKRQKSCGCCPRYIKVLGLSQEKIKYFCTRCANERESSLPLIQWCCS